MDFIALVLAIGALLAFRALNKRTLALESRLEEAKLELAALRAGLGQDGPETVASKDPAPAAAPQATVAPPAETAVPLTPAEESLSVDVPGDIPGSAAPAPARSLEERLGTRWAVWVGGIALALGGIPF